MGFLRRALHRSLRTALGRLLRAAPWDCRQQRDRGAAAGGCLPGFEAGGRGHPADVHHYFLRGGRGPKRRGAGAGGLRARNLVHGRPPGGIEDHVPDARDHAGSHLRAPRGHGAPRGDRPEARPCDHRGCRGSPRRGGPDDGRRRGERVAALRLFRRDEGLQFLRQQAGHHGRRGDGPDGRRPAGRKGPVAAEPLLPARAAVLPRGTWAQLPVDEHAGGAGRGATGADGPDSRTQAPGGAGLRGTSCGHSGRRAPGPA